jgi:hypothetical protein
LQRPGHSSSLPERDSSHSISRRSSFRPQSPRGLTHRLPPLIGLCIEASRSIQRCMAPYSGPWLHPARGNRKEDHTPNPAKARFTPQQEVDSFRQPTVQSIRFPIHPKVPLFPIWGDQRIPLAPSTPLPAVESTFQIPFLDFSPHRNLP